MISTATDFTGLGSLEQAAQALQIQHRNIFACDNNKYAKAAYLANHAPEIFYDDITTRNQDETPEVDLYVFSPPCQSFSISGKRKGFDDVRGTMFFHSLEYIAKKRPRVFIMENVKGLLSHDRDKESKSKYGRTFSTMINLLGSTFNDQMNLFKYDDCLNYHIYFQVLNARHYGIPQNRERIFIVGFRDQVMFKFPKKIPLVLRLKDMLEPVVDEKYYLSDAALAKLIKHYKPIKNDETTLLRWQNKQDGIIESEIAPSIMASGGTDIRKIPYISESITSIGFINQDTQASQVYDTDGLMPTICSGPHGYAIGYIAKPTAKGYTEANPGDSINLQNPNSKTRRGCVGNQIAQTIDTGGMMGVVEPAIAAMRGRNPGNPNSRKAGDLMKQRLEINTSGTANTITSVQKDNYVLMPLFGTECNGEAQRIYDSNGIARTQMGQSDGQGGKTGLYQIHQQDRVNDENGIASSLVAGTHGNASHHTKTLINSRIRRLIPLECFRLFGYTDAFFSNIKYESIQVSKDILLKYPNHKGKRVMTEGERIERMSDTQLYKLAGNSIVKDQFIHILIEICKSLKIPYAEPDVRTTEKPGCKL